MTKRYNESRHKVEYSSYGVLTPIVNKDKNYTLLYNSDGSEQYVVAYAYCEKDNSWGQGHYFDSFYSALEYMFAPQED